MCRKCEKDNLIKKITVEGTTILTQSTATVDLSISGDRLILKVVAGIAIPDGPRLKSGKVSIPIRYCPFCGREF